MQVYENVFSSQNLELTQLFNFSVDAFKLGFLMHGIKDTENFKKCRNKLTSSIRTSKANYFSEAIKSGNNVGELWKHLKNINSVSKCHIKCLTIEGKKCDNIEDICNNFNNALLVLMDDVNLFLYFLKFSVSFIP
jgi:hypothetical protein